MAILYLNTLYIDIINTQYTETVDQAWLRCQKDKEWAQYTNTVDKVVLEDNPQKCLAFDQYITTGYLLQ